MTAGTDPVAIVTLLPELLGTYGDGGNGAVLEQRLLWRGFEVEHHFVSPRHEIPVQRAVYLLGGGEDAAQEAAAKVLLQTSALRRALDAGAVIVGVCAGLQLLGHSFPGREGPHPGLGLLNLVTEPGPVRAVGEIVTEASPAAVASLPLLASDPRFTGFENHAGRTHRGPGVAPLARVLGDGGVGNGDGTDGAIGGEDVDGRVFGTYLHGPVLARNPALADAILTRLLGHELPPLDLPEVTSLRSQRLAATRPARTTTAGNVVGRRS